MGFDFDRSEADDGAYLQADTPAAADNDHYISGLREALNQNLVAERFAIDAYRQIAAHGEGYDEATRRLVKVALAVEEEHAEILSSLIADLSSSPREAKRS